MARKRTAHTVNGKFMGMWYETEAGTRIYLAHRRPRQMHRLKPGWCLDMATLSKCRAQGFTVVGIVCRRGERKDIWLTYLEDFFDPARSFPSLSSMGAERGIRLPHFRVDPAKDAGKIDKALKIG